MPVFLARNTNLDFLVFFFFLHSPITQLPQPNRSLKACQLSSWLGTFIERRIDKCNLINKCHLGNANVLADCVKQTTVLPLLCC